MKTPIIQSMTTMEEKHPARHNRWRSLVFIPIGLLLIGWLLNTPAGLLGKADAIGYAVCHRIGLRSFYFGDRQLPLCARCTGMYLGAMLGLVYQLVIGPKRTGVPPRGVIVVFISFVLFFGVDGVNSFASLFPGVPFLYQPQNWLRLLSGTGMGLAVSAAIFPAFNQTVWSTEDQSPTLSGFRSLGLLLFFGLLVDALVLSGNPLILYPLAIISAAGVLVLLTMTYTMVWLLVLKHENRISNLVELTLPVLGGFALSLVQIGLLDLGRYLLTGTWDGFHLG